MSVYILQVKQLLGVVLPLLTATAESEPSKAAVTSAAAGLGLLLKGLGRGAAEGQHLEAASKMAQALLHGRALCQVRRVCLGRKKAAR